jgi:hypothetical protein
MVMKIETYTQLGFFYNKFVYDNEVDFHKNCQAIKFVTSYIVNNKWFYSIVTIDSICWCIFYP